MNNYYYMHDVDNWKQMSLQTDVEQTPKMVQWIL
jgi:hypothetical protein